MKMEFSIAHFKRWMEDGTKEEGLPTKTSGRAKSETNLVVTRVNL